jgi:dolichyl-diphosphooligosaccharide--protein glycosyltransferase
MSPNKKKRHSDKASKQKPVTGTSQMARQENPAVTKPAAVPRQEADSGRAVAGKPAPGEVPAKPVYRRILSNPLISLAGVLVIALLVRLLPLLYCIKDGHILLVEQDSYYHLRRITYIVQHFPGVNIFDPYVNYPQGYFIGWPPLFDLAAAATAMVAGLGHPGQFVVEAASSAVNVLLGLLGITAAYYLAKDIFGERVALLGALVMAILPATAFVAIFGYVGHHSLEMLASMTMYLLFLRSVTGGKTKGVTFSGIRAHKGPVVYAALAGIAVAAAVFSWDGAPYFIGTIMLYAFVLYALDVRRGESSEYLTVLGIITAVVALVLVAPFAVTSYYGQRMEITAIYLSWFHVIMLAAFAAFFVFMGALGIGAKKAGAPWFAAPAIALLGAGAALLAVRELLPQVYDNLAAGMTFLTGGSAVLSTISEVTPLLSRNGQFSLVIVWTYMGTALLIAIPGLLIYLYSLRKIRIGPAEAFFLLWTAVVGVMGLLQARFIYLLGINVAMLTGYGIYRIAVSAGLERFIKVNFGNPGDGKKSSAKRRLRIPVGLACIVALMALLLLQPLASSYHVATTPLPVTSNWDDATRWIKDNTPATSYTYSAEQGTMPEYGIMTWWDYGNFILYGAERPAVANNFQTGVDDAANFFIAPDEPSADRIMETRNAKYVVVDYLMGSASIGIPGVFDNMALLAGKNVSNYFMSFRRLDPTVSGTMAFVDGNDKYYGTMYSRLYNDRGLGGRNTLGNVTGGLQHYRMVYANSGDDPVIVFEKVAGATIAGMAQPDSKIELRLAVSDGSTDRTYYDVTRADQTGAYSFTVPYATGDTAGAIQTGAHYVLSSGGAKTDVSVPEDAVQHSTTINAGGLQ